VRTVDDETWRHVLARDGGMCQVCCRTDWLQCDHIEPRAAGGTDDPWNLRVLCGRCNKLKWTYYTLSDRMVRDRQVAWYFTHGWHHLTAAQQGRLNTELALLTKVAPDRVRSAFRGLIEPVA